MAHNFQTQGPKVMYSPVTGQNRTCYNDSEIVNAKNDGFTSASYVPSKFPTTVWDKNGKTKTVGTGKDIKADEALLSQALAEGWSADHIAGPEPVAGNAPGFQATPHTDQMLKAVLADFAETKKRVEILDQAALEADAARVALEKRVAELEAIISAAVATPAEHAEPAKAKK